MLIANRRRRPLDIWPGFVDGLAALLMVVIFVLLLFSLGQFLLSDALIGRDAALDRLRGQMASLSALLASERDEKADLAATLDTTRDELATTRTARDDLDTRFSALTLEAERTAEALAALRLELENSRLQLAQQETRIGGLAGERDDLQSALAESEARLVEARSDAARTAEALAALRLELEGSRSQLAERERELSARNARIGSLSAERDRLQGALAGSEESLSAARDQAGQLNSQLAALNEKLARLSKALEVSESELAAKDLEIDNLGERLNLALADKVEELSAYRSEFFGRLREALADNPNVRVEGDRFVLPSEVLFSSASADLDARGRREIASLASTLKDIIAKIPENTDWVLRIDGHTDKRPIRKAFPSNWELSSARATSIVKYLIEQGIPAERLVAAGFAQYHPLDTRDTAEAFSRNRRIEFKLTSR